LQELRGELLGCRTTLHSGFCGHVCQNARMGRQRHHRYRAGSGQNREQGSTMSTSLVADWDNFYVITGSSAAGLTGLTFVVIALASDAKQASARGLRAYITPTIVHFGTVLAQSAYLSMPHQGTLSLSLGFGVAGAAGLIYMAVIASSIGRISSAAYTPVAEDWIWNAILPALVYGVLLAAAFLIWRRPEQCMFAVAGASLLLMFIGIHNSWDIAVWNSVRKQEGPNELS
jgi:hypothetical protein